MKIKTDSAIAERQFEMFDEIYDNAQTLPSDWT